MALAYQRWKAGDVEEDDPSYVMGGSDKAGAERAAVGIMGAPEIALDTTVYPLMFPDVSTWQGVIDWDLMSAQAEVVYIRAGYGNDGIDSRVRDNAAQARLHGMLFGLYWYVKAGKDFRKHIASFDAICEELNPDLPPVWDCEYTDYTENIKNSTTQWLSKLDQNWYSETAIEPIYYTRATWWNANTYRTDWPKQRLLWIAHYTSAEQPAIPDDWGKVAVPRTWTFWQYSADGNALGGTFGVQSNSIDLNRYNGSFDEFEFLFDVDLNSEPPDPPNPPDPPDGEALLFQVLVDTLNIRTGPGTSYPDIGDLRKGDVVEAQDVAGADAWVQIAPGKWTCVKQNAKKFLELI